MAGLTRVFSSVEVSVADPAELRLAMRLPRGVYFGYRLDFDVFPQADQIAVRYGTVAHQGDRVLSHHEVVTFNGDTAQLKYPDPSNITFNQLGLIVDRGLTSVTPSFIYDPYRDAVVPMLAGVQAEVYGAVHVDYTAPYQRYRYDFQTGIINGVFTIAFSSIAARRGRTMARLEIDSDGVESTDYVVFYQVVSEVIVNEDESGGWEKPPGWPGDNSYPGLTITGPKKPALVDERVHEYGYINQDGRISIDRQHIRYLQPYTGSLTYKPDWRMEKNLSPPDGYEAAWAEIPWGDIQLSVQGRYPGVTI